MNGITNTSVHDRTTRRIVAVSAAALTLVAITAAPSSASQEAGPAVSARQPHVGPCQLERLGTQFVRCDDLTGNGVAAPAHVHQQ